jgi:hypothetical protein
MVIASTNDCPFNGRINDNRPHHSRLPNHGSDHCTIYVDQSDWDDLALPDDLTLLPGASGSRLFVTLRPDGHVAAISRNDNDLDKRLLQDTMKSVIRRW